MPAIPFAVAAVSKLALYTLCTSVQVEGLEHLVAALASGKGVLTGARPRLSPRPSLSPATRMYS